MENEKEREEFFMELDRYISLGCTPDSLREYCEEHGYDLDQIYDDDDLSEKYAQHGFSYNAEDNSVVEFVLLEDPDLYEYAEERYLRQIESDIATYACWGYTPDKIKEYCKAHGFNFDEICGFETLKKLYAEYGYEYNDVDNSIKKIEEQEQTPLQQREAQLSSLEVEARGYDEAEALKNQLEQREGQGIGEE